MPTADAGHEDDAPLGEVGPQVHDKHARLRAYVEISAKVRAKFTGPGKAGASYIDLYCGPGRSQVRGSEAIVEGSAIVSILAADDKGHSFTVVHIGDVKPANVESTVAALRALGTSATIVTHIGLATDTAREVAGQLSPWGLHFAFLDPYSLGDLSFSIVEAFAPFRRADLLINICAMDLQRNLEQALTSGETHHCQCRS